MDAFTSAEVREKIAKSESRAPKPKRQAATPKVKVLCSHCGKAHRKPETWAACELKHTRAKAEECQHCHKHHRTEAARAKCQVAFERKASREAQRCPVCGKIHRLESARAKCAAKLAKSERTTQPNPAEKEETPEQRTARADRIFEIAGQLA